ncbi:hypothetical protein C2G38_2294935 [Gigaspora rosea]|uniref:Protein kinase domain-containing protein n=1 Tax=Gigaspora rosea TaxID=44941 RepID=A0A397TXS8_9GLOM|nr:hypothetical protein C2G38_2294935 [Gigaspora rosea]
MKFNDVIEWIHFNKFANIKYLAQGGFGTVFKAVWTDGYIMGLDDETNKWVRKPQIEVCLKSLNNSKDINQDFLKEVKNQHKNGGDSAITIYGITKNPKDDNYMMVMQPRIRCKVPQLLLDLMSKCLDAEPQNRPTANKIANTLNQFCQDLNDEKTELCNQVKQIKNSSKNSSTYDQMKSERLNYKTDPQAIYTSQLLHFPTLPKQLDKPINAWVDGFDITYDDFIEYFYQNRMGVEKNKQKAFKYFQKYAEMWLANGAYSVGHCYAEGIGIEKNNQKAFEYFQKSAEMGHASGTYSVGCRYYEGIGVEKNEKKAFEYYLKSAEMGDADGKNVIKNKYQIIWIPYNEFKDIKEIGKGGFATIYYAKWKFDVALKLVHESHRRFQNFADEVIY